MFFTLFPPKLAVIIFVNELAWTISFYIGKPSCSYQVPKVEDVVLQVRQTELDAKDNVNDGRRFIRSSENGVTSQMNLRIYIYYDNNSFDSTLSETQQDYVRQRLVPEAVEFWQTALSLRHPSDIRIRLNRKCETQKYFIHTTSRQQSCYGSCRAVTKCGEVNVPDEHLNQCHSCSTDDLRTCSFSGPADGPGVAGADFILYVSAVQTDRCSGKETVAYAAHCQQEDTLDRPIAGHVNLCPRSVSDADRDQEVLVSTVKHEILHALGFSAGLFAFYRDETGRPLTPRNEIGKPIAVNRERGYYDWSDRIIKSINRTDWWTRLGRMNHTVHMMVTPRVQKEARDHFGCDTLEGAELENQGSDGTAFTHWEKRVFENEAMTGTHTQSPTYSRLTLALMEDTGWYIANYSVAEWLGWGSNLGCDFATKSCGEWIASRERANLPIAPFCKQLKADGKTSETTTTCTMNRRSVGLCNLKVYNRELPIDYQYFGSIAGAHKDTSSSLGGSVELADYCPYAQEFEWNNTGGRQRDSRCFLAENEPDQVNNAALESYGSNSICFNHVGSWTQRRCHLERTFGRLGAGCHQFECVDGMLWLRLSNVSSYPCYKAGQSIIIRQLIDGWLHEGVIICPPCQDICADDSFECLPETESLVSIGDPEATVMPCSAIRNCIGHPIAILPVAIVWLFRRYG